MPRLFLGFAIAVLLFASESVCESFNCSNLLLGQYRCDEPVIDEETQLPLGCTKENPFTQVKCYAAPDIICEDGSEEFTQSVPCKYTTGKSFQVSVLLSIFLGMFGIDRFYLGYPAIGLLKLCTFGFMLVGQLVDVVLIASQVVLPADGSAYTMDYYSTQLTRIVRDNETLVV